jgi:hypothetical protein
MVVTVWLVNLARRHGSNPILVVADGRLRRSVTATVELHWHGNWLDIGHRNEQAVAWELGAQ